MSRILEFIHGLDLPGAFLFFGVANVLIFTVSVAACWWLGRRFHDRRLFDRWQPFSAVEGLAAFGATALNVMVSVVGWKLWLVDVITLKLKSPWGRLLDTLLMVLAMDLGMYLLHRLAHHPGVYRTFHTFHHRHDVTNPISLFVLHPFEVGGFGGLMLGFLAIYPMDPWALVAYLTLNVVFGTIGHSGVEPFPALLSRIPLLRLVGTSTFHAEHHEHPSYNFGFYTLIWDEFFGTLDPQYWSRYRAAAAFSSRSKMA